MQDDQVLEEDRIAKSLEKDVPTAKAPGLCVPSHHPGAVRFLEQHARIIKLPGGSRRVWLRSADLRMYGSTRWAALDEAASRVKGRLLSEVPARR